MLVLSDEPKAIVLVAEKLMAISPTIAWNYQLDELAFKLRGCMEALRSADRHGRPGFVGGNGFVVFIFEDEDGSEEIKVMLDIAAFHRFSDNSGPQQFVQNDGPWIYDESCPAEWVEE